MIRLSALFAALALASACGDRGAPSTPLHHASPATPAASPAMLADGGLASSADGQPPLTAAQLTPRFSFDTPPDDTPNVLFIAFPDAPALQSAQLGYTGPGRENRVSVTPETPINVHVHTPGVLAVYFPQSLAPATDYRFTLDAIATPEGTLTRPANATEWTTTFRTPPLALRTVRVENFSIQANNAVLRLDFSGPVQQHLLSRLLTFEVEGAAPQQVYLTAQGPRSFTANLRTRALRENGTVRVALAEGPAFNAARISAANFEVPLPAKLLRIEYAQLEEATDGFVVDVRCASHDANGNRADWSRGCELAEGAEEKISVEPEVRISVSPTRWGFRIFGDFPRGPLRLTLGQGLRSSDGAVLSGSWEQNFNRPQRRPRLAFTAVGRYLPREAWRNLGFTHVNQSQVELTVRHVPPENLVFWMSEETSDAATQRTSNLLVRKVIPVKGEEDTSHTSFIDVASLLPAHTRGVLQISLQGSGQSASSRLLLTDMSLVAKRMPGVTENLTEAVKIWALGISTNKLLAGVVISAVRPSGKVLATCTTVAETGCTLELPKDPVDPTPPFALIARNGEDLTYLRYSDLKVEISEADVSGEAYRSQKPYRVAVWTDRGVYRPGDTAHISAIVRDASDVAPKASLPVELTVLDPRRRVVRRSVLQTNPAGLISQDVSFEAFADTGVYSVRFAIAERQVAQTSVNVEEFVPERMKVTATPTGEGFALGEPIAIDVEAKYLFGGSAEKSPVELSCQLEQGHFAPSLRADFTYDVYREAGKRSKPLTLGQVQETLDEKGQKRLSCPAADGALPFRGSARLVAQAAVFEAGSGRSTQTSVRVPVHPERYYLGLKTAATKAESGKPFRVSGVVVDWDGNLVGNVVKEVELEFVRLESEYGYTWNEEEGTERYRRYLRPLREGRSKVAVKADGTFSFEVTPGASSAGFLVKAKSGSAQTDLELEGEYDDWRWWGDENGQVDMTPRPSRPTSLHVSLPKRAKVGETVTATLRIPYRGTLLLTTETDRVVSSEWRVVEAGEVKWEFTPKAFAPTLYVSALLVKDPHIESKEAFLPDRAFGVANLALEPTAYTHELTLTVPKELRSGSTLEVELDVGPQTEPTFATVAAVDEGILQLTRFATPDPLAQIFTKRALGVSTYETLGWTLLMPPQGNSRSTGGDGESASPGRVQPVKPVALWSGVVEIPASGKAKVSLEVPQFRGALRVMAVSVGPKKVGHASAEVKVRDPITLTTTLPRFLIQNDLVQIPVFVTNLAGKPLDVTVSLTAENLEVPGLALPKGESPLQLLGKSVGQVALEKGKSATLVFQARATKAIGAARLTVRAKGGGHESSESLEVPFTPSGPRERQVQRIELAQGKTGLADALKGWVPTTEKSTVWITTNPYGPAFDHLSYLVRYPYGCLEQTTSSARPLLAMGSLVDRVDPTLVGKASLEEMVHSGVNRILSMQTPEGGFAYWPGSTEPVSWASAYATHFLIDAQKAKYTVPQGRIDEAIRYLGRELDKIESGAARPQGYWGNTRHSEAYMHYVLAVGGKPRKAAVAQRIKDLPRREKWDGMTAENAYLLKAALWLAGDRRHEKELKALDSFVAVGGQNERLNNWSFYSDQRRRGLMLSVFGDLFGADPAGESLAQQLAEQLAKQRSGAYTTQELIWSLTALHKRLGGTRAAEFSVPVLLAGTKKIEAKVRAQDNSSERSWTVARASELPDLAVQVDKKSDGRLFAILSSEGVREGGKWRQGGRGLSLSRTFRTLDGTPVSAIGGSLSLADLVFVEIEVKNETAARVQNLAMVSRLPAGWEIENPRLGRGGEVSWVSPESLWSPDYLAVKDDRLEVFGSLGPHESKKVVFAVRAVTAGSFTMPPVELEAMYDPTLWAREAGGATEVAGPWKDFLL